MAKQMTITSSYQFSTLAIALAYAAAGWAGIQLAIPPGYVTAIFPASGIALAVLLVDGAI